jgi:hypothetical protein
LKYRLLALDLDGTLLDSRGRVPPANVDALRRARRAGLFTVLCTGRGLKESRRVLDELRHDQPTILANGALIADPETGTTLHRAAMEPHVALKVVEHLCRGDDAVLVLLDPAEVEHDYLIIREHRLTANSRWWFDHVGATYRSVDRACEQDLHHAVRVGIVGPASHMPPVAASLVERFSPGLFVQHFTAVDNSESGGEQIHVLEVFSAGVSKWSALQWLGEAHNIGPGQIAAIGDQINDVDMLREAGCGIAMGNAVPEAAAAARHQTAGNDDSGVAVAIDRLLAGDW